MNKHNNQTICFDCAIRPNRGILEQPSANESCKDCVRGIDPIFCEVCGKEMVYCKKFRYYHDVEVRRFNCVQFIEKKGEKTGKL